MNRDNRSSSHDPSDEAQAEQSSQTAGGLTTGREGPGVQRGGSDDAEVVNRTEEAGSTPPRRYEQPVEEDEDPVMPGEDPTLGTKI